MKTIEETRIISAQSATCETGYRLVYLQAAVIFTLTALIYLPVFEELIKMWWRSDDYNHGFLVPFIFLYLVWRKRERLRGIEPSGNIYAGVPLVLMAGVALVLGKLGGLAVLEEISLIMMIAGLVLLLMGGTYLYALTLPIAYLFFMIKIFSEGPQSFHWPFQLLAADIGVFLLQTFGIPAYQHAQYIQIPNITLKVASACSGVRFLVSIVAIGIPLAVITQRTAVRKLLLVLLAVIIAILGNGLRVALIGGWSYYGGSSVHGPLHIFQGIFVAVIGFAALFAGAWFMGKKERDGRTQGFAGVTPQRPSNFITFLQGLLLRAERGTGWNSAWITACVLLTLTGGFYYLHRINRVEMVEYLQKIPMNIDGWTGSVMNPSGAFLRVEDASVETLRSYTNKDGDSSEFYIGYFDKQTQGRELINYRTSWKFHRGETVVDIHLGGGSTYRVNRVVMGDKHRVVFFWYDLNGRTYASRYFAKLQSIADALIRGANNGAILAVSLPYSSNKQINDRIAKGRALTRDIITILYTGRSRGLKYKTKAEKSK